MEPVIQRALEDAELLAGAGLHGVMVENYGDRPFYPECVPPETAAAMAVVVREIVRSVSLPVGVNVLRNDAGTALGVAAAAGAAFVRVNVHTGSMYTDQGVLHGKAHQTLRTRQILDPSLLILADVMVKHATPPPGLTLQAASRDAWHRGMADVILVTGPETGQPVRKGDLETVREALPPEARVWIASGAGARNAPSLLREAHGLIVGSDLQKDGRGGSGVDPERLRAFMDGLRAATRKGPPSAQETR
jgi:membrane complex biogenesis BtpA family protein